MSAFGRDDAREMPAHLFMRSVRIKYETAVRSDPDKQNCSICPRYWYELPPRVNENRRRLASQIARADRTAG